ncbi:hypothetical protein ACVDHI_08815 [Aeromonas sp. 25-248]
MKTIIKTFVIICVVIISSFPLFLYLIKFGINPDSSLNFTFTDKIDEWGAFGGFIGGTIGPIISCIAFLGIWKTYQLQSKQLQQANNQRKSEDVQRLIFIVAERIDLRLKKQVDILSVMNGSNHTESKFDLETAIAFIRGVKTQPEHNLENSAPKLVQHISLELTQLKIDVENLSWLLQHQESIFNETTIIEFYSYRYRPILKTMCLIGINLLPITLDVFELNERMMAE